MLRQLIPTRPAVLLILLTIDPIGLRQDLADDPPVVIGRLLRSVRAQLRPIDRDHTHAHQPRLRAQLQHAVEQAGQRLLMPLAKARDRRVIRLLIRRHHPHRDVLHTRPLDPPRGHQPMRIRVEQHADHSTADQTPRGCARQGDTPDRTPTDPAAPPSPTQTTQSDPPATTPATTAASTTPAPDPPQ